MAGVAFKHVKYESSPFSAELRLEGTVKHAFRGLPYWAPRSKTLLRALRKAAFFDREACERCVVGRTERFEEMRLYESACEMHSPQKISMMYRECLHAIFCEYNVVSKSNKRSEPITHVTLCRIYNNDIIIEITSILVKSSKLCVYKYKLIE